MKNKDKIAKIWNEIQEEISRVEEEDYSLISGLIIEHVLNSDDPWKTKEKIKELLIIERRKINSKCNEIVESRQEELEELERREEANLIPLIDYGYKA